MLFEHLLLPLQLLEVAAKPVTDVAVLREKPQRSPLAAAADQDLWSTRLDGTWHVERALDPVVLTLERRALLGEHQLGDGQRFVEPVHALSDGRKFNAVAIVLILVPGCADATDGVACR